MHLVGFIIKKFVTMHGHMNVKFARSISTPAPPQKKKGMGKEWIYVAQIRNNQRALVNKAVKTSG